MKKSPIEDLTQERLLSKLRATGIPKLKVQPVEALLKSYFIASNYHNHMKTVECAALSEEIKFYRSCYAIQKEYIDSVMHLFKSKYEQFINELNQNFNEPLNMLIRKFWQMRDESTEENLKEFLGLFKAYAQKFDTILKNFELMPKSDLVTAKFIELLRQLDKEVEKLNKECKSNLDKINIEKINLEDLTLKSENVLYEILNDENNQISNYNMQQSSSINSSP